MREKMETKESKIVQKYIVLSQKRDIESSYSDELFHIYHFPSKYRNQIHEGDIFVYYQGNRNHREMRYYFGTGIVGQVSAADGESWYAELKNCKEFSNNVPLYYNGNNYIEQIGYTGKRMMPPFQTSIRSLTKEAYEYIISKAGFLNDVKPADKDILIDEAGLDQKLLDAVNDYFLSHDTNALTQIINAAESLRKLSAADGVHSENTVTQLMDYCKSMRMSYSYKPALIKALIENGNADGKISIRRAANYFRSYYTLRQTKGEKIEKDNCVLKNDNVTTSSIEKCIINNPIKALCASEYFVYDEAEKNFGIRNDIWKNMTMKEMRALQDICDDRIRNYFASK